MIYMFHAKDYINAVCASCRVSFSKWLLYVIMGNEERNI